MLPEVTRILYASDLGKGARPAFRRAVSLCGHYQSHITFLHVAEPVGEYAENLVKSMMNADASLKALHDESLESMRQAVKERVERFCREELDADTLLEAGSLSVRVEEGRPWKTILNVADDMEADVIVIGARHQSSLLGHTASKVMHNSRRSVLMVPL